MTGDTSRVADQPNWWCVEGMFQVYTHAKLPNDKGFMTPTLTLERWVLTGCLPTMPSIHGLFTEHRLEWMARDVGRYSEELVRESYALYVVTLRSQRDTRADPAKQAPLEHIRVRNKRVEIYFKAIRRYIYDKTLNSN